MPRPADPELERWLVRLTPALPPLDLAALRAPRPREPGPALPVVSDLVVPAPPADAPAAEDPAVAPTADHGPRGASGQAAADIPSDTPAAPTPPVPARLYRPSEHPLPLVVYVHGGGFAFGGLDSHDRLCRRIALGAGCAVLALDVRLAPEHPAPAAIDDVVTAVAWAAKHPALLGPIVGAPAIAGDSSGAATAVLAAARLARMPVPLAALWLANPNADLTLSQPSVTEFGEGFGIETASLRWLIERWVPRLDAESLAAFSPLHAQLRGLPVTRIYAAELDPLRDEGLALARHLVEQGVDAASTLIPGMVHGFLTLDTLSPASATAGERFIAELGAALPR